MPVLDEFIKNDCAAVATDWVVISSGLVGIGLATLAAVSGGVNELGGGVTVSLADTTPGGFMNGLQEIATFDFANGFADGWVGGAVMDMGGELGELLVVGQQETAGFTLDIPPSTELATLNFDLIAGDTLDASDRWGYDTGTVMINGVPVAVALNTGQDSIVVDIPQVDGTTVEAVVTVNSQNLGGRGRSEDSIANITVEVSNPTADLQFEFVSGANQGIRDEFWGIDNFNAGVRS